MSDPDNVARLIAVGSGLVAAANMAVSYASYRRKRARLEVKLGDQSIDYTVHGELRPAFDLMLMNRGETSVRINWAYLTMRNAARALPRRLTRLRAMATTGLELFEGRHFSTVTELPFELGGLGEEKVKLTVIGCSAFLNDPDHQICRVTVGLSSGRVVRSGWQRKALGQVDCTCPDCHEEGGEQQLSFDDLLQDN
ncbi:hypothetical protein [Streptomyces sp. NPDC054834]